MSNISMLARVTGGDDALTSGFVISGLTPRQVLVRAVGPSLAAFGVAEPLGLPQLTVFRGSRVIGTNEGWAKDADTARVLTDAFERTGAFRLQDDTSRDAAIMLTLQPGPYTMQVRSVDRKAGAALLEVYEIP